MDDDDENENDQKVERISRPDDVSNCVTSLAAVAYNIIITSSDRSRCGGERCNSRR